VNLIIPKITEISPSTDNSLYEMYDPRNTDATGFKCFLAADIILERIKHNKAGSQKIPPSPKSAKNPVRTVFALSVVGNLKWGPIKFSS
jgi:hypothetical protein